MPQGLKRLRKNLSVQNRVLEAWMKTNQYGSPG
jgi:hypothetical protein